MLENNLFFGSEPQSSQQFIFYLLSFAMEEYQTTDPVLADYAKELIRYIIGADGTQDITVTDIQKRQMMNDFAPTSDLHGLNAAYIYQNAMQSAAFSRFSDQDGKQKYSDQSNQR